MNRLFTLIVALMAAVASWAATTFTSDLLVYEPFAEPTSEGYGSVSLTGVSALARTKINWAVTVPNYVENDGKRYYVATIANGVFKDRLNLISLDMSQALHLTYFGEEAAKNCTRLKTVKCASGIISKYAFQGCTALASLDLGKVTTINWRAFDGCTALTGVTIPASATKINNTFLSDCSGVKSITVDEGNTKYCAYDGCLYRYDSGSLLSLEVVPAAYPKTRWVPSPNVWEIKEFAFWGAVNIEQVVFPHGIRTIEKETFYNCHNLKVVTIPNGVTLGDCPIFYGCENLTDLACNMNTPKRISKGDLMMECGSANPNLYVPRDRVDAYLNAGWTGFKSVNRDNMVAFDLDSRRGFGYIINSTKQTKLFGKTYDGMAHTVRTLFTLEQTGRLPADVENIVGKKFAVTRIGRYTFQGLGRGVFETENNILSVGEGAFKDATAIRVWLEHCTSIEDEAFYNTHALTLSALSSVEEIGNSAFANCTMPNPLSLGNNLKTIGANAFENVDMGEKVFLPLGLTTIGARAFAGSTTQLLHVPSTATQIDNNAFDDMKKLKDLYINATEIYSQKSWTAANRNKDCVLHYPVATFPQGMNSPFDQSHEQIGAYDIAHEFNHDSPYKATVTSMDPVTVGGVKYDGTVTLVLSDNHTVASDSTFCPPQPYIAYDRNGANKKFLITDIQRYAYRGNQQFKKYDFSALTSLKTVDHNVFESSVANSIIMPDCQIQFSARAFCLAPQLKELVIPHDFTWTAPLFIENHKDLVCYVPYDRLADLAKSVMKSIPFIGTGTENTCDMHLAPCFRATGTTFALGAVVPLDFQNSPGIKAYGSRGLDANGNLKTVRYYRTNGTGEGFILTDLKPGQLYKVKRQHYTNPPEIINTDIRAALEDVDVASMTDAYYWDTDNKKFVRPTSATTVKSGSGYLLMPGGPNPVYLDLFAPPTKRGDVNGDGTVDVTDVNLTINVMLGKATKAQYPAADVNGDGTVDVTDVNLIINVMLGK